MARPKVATKKKKTQQIFINITENEKKKLSRIAEEKGVSLSQLGRMALKKANYI